MGCICGWVLDFSICRYINEIDWVCAIICGGIMVTRMHCWVGYHWSGTKAITKFDVIDHHVVLMLQDVWLFPNAHAIGLKRRRQHIFPVHSYEIILKLYNKLDGPKEFEYHTQRANEMSANDIAYIMVNRLKGRIPLCKGKIYGSDGYEKNDIWEFLNKSKHLMAKLYDINIGYEFAMKAFGV